MGHQLTFDITPQKDDASKKLDESKFNNNSDKKSKHKHKKK